jgi:hypothetical protein
VQVEEGLVVATVVEDLGAPPLSVTATAVEEGRTDAETTAPKWYWSHRPGLARAG